MFHSNTHKHAPADTLCKGHLYNACITKASIVSNRPNLILASTIWPGCVLMIRSFCLWGWVKHLEPYRLERLTYQIAHCQAGFSSYVLSFLGGHGLRQQDTPTTRNLTNRQPMQRNGSPLILREGSL